MKLGWIDFSKEERNRVLTTLKLLEESVALDELGIGVIRDGFSDILFPGISTLQTRAKYFVLVPYIFAIAEKEKLKRSAEIHKWINNKEDRIVATLINNSANDATGIIGLRSFKQGKTVKMKPSSIYWNGLKTFEILRDSNVSIGNVCELIVGRSSRKNQLSIKSEGDTFDDLTAANESSTVFSPVIPDYNIDKEIDIALTQREAIFLLEKITSAKLSRHSLLAFLIKNQLSFSSFDEIDAGILPSDIKIDYLLAKDFANFINGMHIRYNVIFSNGEDVDQINKYVEWYKSFKFDTFDLASIMNRVPSGNATSAFLKLFYQFSASNDLVALDKLIISREKSIKNDRAKLNKPQEYRYDKAIHDYKLQYRFGTVQTIVNDIVQGLAVQNG